MNQRNQSEKRPKPQETKNNYGHQHLHAPYDFVPVSRFVHMPAWAHQVSHDVPFKKGLSGEIHYSLTNATPLCVGGEQEKQPDETTLVKWAKNSQGQPVIPATSIKGMIRNVLEIASFGKMHLIDTSRQLSFRDLSSKSYYLTNVIQDSKNVTAGWLKHDAKQGKWRFMSCDCVKVKHSEIRRVFGKELKNSESALAKFKKIPLTASCYATISEPKGKQGNRWAEQLTKENNPKQDQVKGHFMFTDPKIFNAKKQKAEDFEFSYFFYQRRDYESKDGVQQKVNHLLDNNNKELADYLQKNQHPELGFPVFALLDKKNNLKLKALGFAKMPRVPYAYQPHKLLHAYQKKHQHPAMFDMAELVLGTTREQAGYSLKSRVFFSDLKSKKPITLEDSHYMILNSPKPTFYPAYVEQDRAKDDTYKDFNCNKNTLAGWKRYIRFEPENKNKITNLKNPEQDKSTSDKKDKNLKVFSQMELAPIQSTFTGKCVFHNLLPEELGALLWSMTFHQDQSVYHSLGHGKSLGAGAVQLSLDQCQISDHHNQEHTVATCLAAFSEHMNQHYQEAYDSAHKPTWQESPQIQSLLALGRLKDNSENAELNTKYMVINNPTTEQAGFTQAKNKKHTLPLFAGIDRQESIKKDYSSTAFAQGRLAHLFNKADEDVPDKAWYDKEKGAADNKREALETQKKQQEDEAAERRRIAAMRPQERDIEQLRIQLDTCHQSDQAGLIRKTMQDFLAINGSLAPEDAKALHDLARKYDYHEKPKKHKKEQKNQLNQLKVLFEKVSV